VENEAYEKEFPGMRFCLLKHGLLVATLIELGILSSGPIVANTIPEATPLSASQNEVNQSPSADLTSSASQEFSSDEGPNDPLEPLNRFVFSINEILDFALLRPVAEIYRAVTPDPLKRGVSNVLDNLFAPVSFLNHIFQGEPERATVTLFRFLLNSSIGFLGISDFASDRGYPRYDTDFNQTLITWGIDTGPYLVLPLLGSSSFRGTAGFVADYYADPLNIYLNNHHHWKYHYWLTVRYGFDMLRNREKVIETIDNLRSGSFDFYITMRSIYFQRQAYLAEKLKSAKSPEVAKEEQTRVTS